MDAQELRNLSEAYMEVVMNEAIDDEDAPSRQKSHNPDFYGSKLQRMMRKRNPGGGPKMDKSKRNFEKYKKSGKAPSWWEKTNEEVDIYDIILAHLLDEGYAETPEAAEAMMVNMSEGWRESIVEAFVDPETGKAPSGRSPIENVSYHPKSKVRRKAMRAFAYQMGKEYGGKWKSKTKDPTKD